MAAVIFFCVVTLPAAPRGVAWTARSRLPAPRRSPARFTSTRTRSDGRGDRDADRGRGVARRAAVRHPHRPRRRHADAGSARSTSTASCASTASRSAPNGGHYVALGLRPAPYPLGGDAVRRRRGRRAARRVRLRGASGFAAGPSWPGRDWTAPIDGIEWLNADSEWRDESRARARARAARLPGAARPGARLDARSAGRRRSARWDALTARRPVVAHCRPRRARRIGRRAEGGQRTAGRTGVPSYEASFRTFSVRAVLSAPPSGDASADARALLDAMRNGPGLHGGRRHGRTRGARLPRGARRTRPRRWGRCCRPGPAVLSVAGAVPAGCADGVVPRRAGDRVGATAERSSSTRPRPGGLPRRGPGARRARDAAGAVAGEQSDLFPSAAPSRLPSRSRAGGTSFPDGMPWHVEKDPGSTGTVTTAVRRRSRSSTRCAPATAPASSSPLVADLQARSRSFAAITFTGQAARPARVSVQLRYPSGGGERWGRSVYLDPAPRDSSSRSMRWRPPTGRPDRRPTRRQRPSLLFVVDLTNALPGRPRTRSGLPQRRVRPLTVTPSGPARSPAAPR